MLAAQLAGPWLASPAAAQVPHPIVVGKITAVVDGINLIPSAITLTADHHVAFTISNAGRTAVTQPFVSDVYVKNVRQDTYKQQSLGAQAHVAVVSTLARVDSCGPVQIRIVADVQQVVAEANEADNTATATATPICPDLAVTAMKQDWQDANTRYKVQITVTNIGNGPSLAPVAARAWGGPGGLDVATMPILQDVQIPPLAPGASTTYHLSGVYLGTTTVLVKVYLDFFHAIVEKGVDNNYATKQFGPH